MEIKSLNTGRPRKIHFNGQIFETGIFKSPVPGPLVLESENVLGDSVVDRKVHGGPDKACYLYSLDHYPFWKKKYPGLNWDFGMFGENLTIAGLNETTIHIGDIFKIGEALAQAVQPRQPCFKLGIRFQDPLILKKFVQTTFSGVYLRILKPGPVKIGDGLVLKAQGSELSVAEVFGLLFQKEIKASVVEKALGNEILPENCKKAIRARLK